MSGRVRARRLASPVRRDRRHDLHRQSERRCPRERPGTRDGPGRQGHDALQSRRVVAAGAVMPSASRPSVATVPAIPHSPQERLLDPIARVSEILFGLIMALTFTTTIGAATAGREEIRTLLVAAVGCNIAWGLVDAVMFVMSALTERGRGLLTIRAVHNAASVEEAHSLISQRGAAGSGGDPREGRSRAHAPGPAPHAQTFLPAVWRRRTGSARWPCSCSSSCRPFRS